MRYVPGRAFPPYAFLPGRDPHPTRDPRGHSYGAPDDDAPWLPPERWREDEGYLFGVDLYNAGYLWEAHEAWEARWHAAKGEPLQAEFLQGLIQCAAACLKVPMDQPAGLARLADLGTERLARVARAHPRFMGLEVEPFAEAVRAFAASGPESIEPRPRLVLER